LLRFVHSSIQYRAVQKAPRKNKESNMSKLAGKIALVTGGNGGLGLAAAKRFVAEGATVYISGRRQRELDSAVREIGAGVAGIQGDIANLADLDRMFATIRERSGRLDILFANAGIGEFVPLGEITEEHFDRIFGVNVRGTVFTIQKAIPLMRDGGTIVINGSMVSVKGMAAFSVYAATKAALRSFARTWSVDLKGRGIRINVVSPGTVITPGYSALGDAHIDQIKQGVAATTPLGRVGTPEEIASAVVFLASDESSYMTGADLFVDCGAAQVGPLP
jgi:NAD(P)-dependent dehydrogenase (short-subunit alcohol dehydrogenase family)